MISDLNKNFGGLTDLAKKKHGSADLRTLIHPLIQAADDSNRTDSPAEHSALSEIVSLVCSRDILVFSLCKFNH